MHVQYLSHPLSEDTPSYGNRDKVILETKSSISEGDTSNTTDFRLTNNHIGTHIDVPKHFYDSGSTLTDVSPEDWIFNSVNLIDIPCENGRLIEKDDFESIRIKENVDFLIIRTGFEKMRKEDKYWNAYPGISEETCEYLRENFKQLRAVGFDFISLTSPLFKELRKSFCGCKCNLYLHIVQTFYSFFP